MQRALWSAATGMHAQQMKIDTIANNLANVNTGGYKKSRAEFQDLMYQTLRAAGTSSSSTTRHAAGIQVGLGTKPSAVKKIFSEGDLKITENPLDLAIQGAGFFKILMDDGTTAYTRNGALSVDRDGQVVNSEGYPLDPPITLPPDTLSMTVAPDGTVSVVQPAQDTASEIGQIELASFINPAGLLNEGGTRFRRTETAGDPLDGTPGLDGLGLIAQGFLELSNVSIVTELVDLIAAQRAYELNSRAIQASDDMLQQLNNMAR